ncbi:MULTISPECIES: heat-inducible transcriptional repressor HrcA [unclassified Anaerotruncus]|jgi:heat-inducible transcriptional repressor|uniref:heat-inducible transcriptional repressor HrcA n=1 Tax=unclassified Anaerotruncus TaxID=2641626 RepID=UPI0003375270|nr:MULTISPECIES: heat-inducible transcriptional repressor HrcA [unclassified Anaerotruncus]EOS65553.1 heat-inducible transcription repressor HrcA [Anaerotruncus sp. G3(2012)]NBK17350.1 heat-inducible transcription repressor HrcA [Anaerotruncus sp. 1XD42-93]NCE74345.1 heat-inducible transcription repressor HrcA [Anaerotruncus sp. X29]RKJ95959.1 heat-inducible transcription repressor HrcA [Anaerotruncus sp. 1XD22-93]
MKLDIRKLKILTAIVETYIDTGEPVSSKILAQQLGFSVSSATIRNDMAALFEMGLLEQPHTSAGRVPSHLGYRVYVDQLMHCKPLSEEERREIDALFNVRDPDPDKLLEDAAQALADYTNCATVSTTITPKTVLVKRVEIVPAGTRTVVVLVIATNGVIKNKVCRVDFRVTGEIVEFLNQFANGRLVGRSVNDISQWYINSISVTLGDYSQLFIPVLATIYELCREINDGQFYTSGGANLLNYKELADIARDLLSAMANREQLLGVIGSKSDAVFITIGKENNQSELTDTSVVVTKYRIGEQNSGAIGVIGPVRMDYAKLIPHLEYFSQTLGKLLAETFEQEN